MHFRPVDTKSFGSSSAAALGAVRVAGDDLPLRCTGSAPRSTSASRGRSRGSSSGCTFNLAPGLFARRDGDRTALGCALHYVASPVVSFGVEPSVELVTHTPTSLLTSNLSPEFGLLIEPLAALRLRFSSGLRLGFAAGPGFGGGRGAPTSAA